MGVLLICLIVLIGILFKYFNRDYFVLAGCKRVKTVDGSKLDTKVFLVPSKSIFGNNLDVIGATPESIFRFVRDTAEKAKGKSFLMHYFRSPVYGIINAEDAEEVLQSQDLITKANIYKFITPLLGLGLLTSTDDLWHSRRKLLTPAFHFNILKTFLEVFKEESLKIIDVLNQKANGVICLTDLIPQFTLNSICETSLGVKLDNIPGSVHYRNAINALEPIFVNRLCNPILFYDIFHICTPYYWKERKLLQVVHSFSSQIIEKRRQEFRKRNGSIIEEEIDEYGKKRRYAMLDTLLSAEMQGSINHQGICDEVNTFMFEGYDTTSACLTFSLFNLAIHQDVQEKCYEEIRNLGPLEALTVFDFNKLEYMECVIKETLRLYPSVPFLARGTVKETVINGFVFPPNANIHLHTFDIMRDERHFPEPNKFDPERFRPENTTHRNSFAFVPFSAGPRNCIGQKFAMLEVKVLLVAFLKNFALQPITNLDEVTFENGLILRTKEKLKIKVIPRK